MPEGRRRPGRKPGSGPRHDAKDNRRPRDSRRDEGPAVEPPPPPTARRVDEPGLPTATVLVKAKRARPFFGRHPCALNILGAKDVQLLWVFLHGQLNWPVIGHTL